MLGSLALRTQENYAGAVRDWLCFARSSGVSSTRPSDLDLLRFIASLADSGSARTLAGKISGVATIWSMFGWSLPMTKRVYRFIDGLKKSAKAVSTDPPICPHDWLPQSLPLATCKRFP